MVLPPDDLYVGIDTDGSSNPYEGYMDEVIIYPYARSADQINTDFAGGQTGVVFGQQVEDWMTDGLVGYWKMDDDVTGDSQTIVDYSGAGNDGTTSDGNITLDCESAGKFNLGCNFDGSDDYIDISDSSVFDIDPNQDYTWSYWIKPDGFTEWSAVWSQTVVADTYFIVYAHNESGQVTQGLSVGLYSSAGNGLYRHSNDNVLSADTWHHVVVTYDSSRIGAERLWVYVDGVNQNENSGNTGTLSNISTTDIQIGSNAAYSNEFFDGDVDETRIYNRALSSTEVEKLYKWAPGPVGYWSFDEGSGTSSANRSGVYTDAASFNSGWGWTTGRFGKAVRQLNSSSGGTAQIVANPENYISSTSNSFTLSTHFRIDDASGLSYYWMENNILGRTALTNDSGCTTRLGLSVQAQSASSLEVFGLVAHHNAGTACNANDTVGSGTAVNQGQWYHAGLTFNGETQLIEYYLDGVLINSATWGGTGDWTTSGSGLYFGEQGAPGMVIGLSIDETKIYDYVRTPQQIVEDMNAGHPAPGSPIGSALGHWKFDKGYGTAAYDHGTGGNNLTLTGSYSWSNDGKLAA